MSDNLFVNSLKFVFRDLLGDILYFPIWWYTVGTKRAAVFMFKEIRETSRRLALGILLSHLFKPMYGQYDLAGRVISFFFRTIQLLWSFVMVLIWSVVIAVLFLLWLLLPVITVWQIIIIWSKVFI